MVCRLSPVLRLVSLPLRVGSSLRRRRSRVFYSDRVTFHRSANQVTLSLPVPLIFLCGSATFGFAVPHGRDLLVIAAVCFLEFMGFVWWPVGAFGFLFWACLESVGVWYDGGGFYLGVMMFGCNLGLERMGFFSLEDGKKKNCCVTSLVFAITIRAL